MDSVVKSNLIVPNHVAVIMDGNGRWAKRQGKERLEGHYEGVMSVRSAIESCLDLGVRYLTIYAFSTENWGRPDDEVQGLMELFCKTISMEIPSLVDKKVRMKFIGDIPALNADVKESIDFCEDKTKEFDTLTLCVALNYGSQQEIADGVKQLFRKVQNGEIQIDDIDTKAIGDALYTSAIPNPDLMIRTSGEQRISNFLLWQLAYSEFYFTEVLWPDFRTEQFKEAIEEYSRRNRRYGKV